MIANYHAHTTRCNHATGTEREYVEAAIQRGLKIFGFSDHTPQYFPSGYCTFMRMRTHELPEYCMEVRKLQREYKDQIQVRLGLEVEYYPAIWRDLLMRAQDSGVEYMILGQHWLGNEIDEPGSAAACCDEHTLQRYCHQVSNAMETGKLTYIAHPDLINFVGDAKIYRKHIRDLCRVANETGTPLEINLLGLAYGRHYPNPLFWEVAAEEGCKAILGLDAHAPAHILNEESEKRALEMVRSLGINLQDTVELKRI